MLQVDLSEQWCQRTPYALTWNVQCDVASKPMLWPGCPILHEIEIFHSKAAHVHTRDIKFQVQAYDARTSPMIADDPSALLCSTKSQPAT